MCSCILDPDTPATKEHPMARRWSVPPARERGEVLLASGPSDVFHCIYSFPSAIAAVLFGGFATCLVLDPGKATRAELVIGTILLAGLAFLFLAGFMWCRRFGGGLRGAARSCATFRVERSSSRGLRSPLSNPACTMEWSCDHWLHAWSMARPTWSPFSTEQTGNEIFSPRNSRPKVPATWAPT